MTYYIYEKKEIFKEKLFIESSRDNRRVNRSI